jgi:hypothetical protein
VALTEEVLKGLLIATAYYVFALHWLIRRAQRESLLD